MKKCLLSLMMVTIFLSSCKKDDPTTPNDQTKTTGSESVSGSITKNTTWKSSNIYILQGKVVVENGAMLTIEAGTIIKGAEGESSTASALIITRGSKIMAEGTAEKPIIFTSVLDEIKVGETTSTLTEVDNGLWGGLLILGKAPISADADSKQIEGIPADLTYGLYGGTESDDNSGSIKYVSVRFGGALIGEGNEINGITFGGVGSKTTVENIEVVANKDDGVEFFGGTVNVKNILVWASADDGIDIDQAYSGTIQNAIVISGDKTDSGLEIDGPEGTLAGKFSITNLKVKGNTTNKMIDFRDGAMGKIENAYFFGFATPSSSAGIIQIKDDNSSENYKNKDLQLVSIEITLTGGELSNVFVDKSTSQASKIGDDLSFASLVELGKNTKGADSKVFDWTFAKAKNALDF